MLAPAHPLVKCAFILSADAAALAGARPQPKLADMLRRILPFLALLTFAYPQFSQVTLTDVPIGQQRYDSFQAKINRRFSKGLTFTMSFTLAKTFEQIAPLNAQDVDLKNLTNTKLEKRLTQYDVPRQISYIGSYDLPFGRGRHYGNGMNKFFDGFIGGWTMSGVYMTHSGYVFDFPNAAPLEARSAKFTDAQRDGRTLYVDLSGVTFIDSRGLGALLAANERAAKAIRPGMHGSTFGGNALATRVGLEFFNILDELPTLTQKVSKLVASAAGGEGSTIQRVQKAAAELEQATANVGANPRASAIPRETVSHLENLPLENDDHDRTR